jgi:hypothetical protein
MAVRYDKDGGTTPPSTPKPPKPVTYPWQQQTPKPVTYASTPTPRAPQTPRPQQTPTPPNSNPLGNLLGTINNWIWRNNPQKVPPVQIKPTYPTFNDWMWRNNPGRFNPNTPTGRTQMQTYASSGASQDPRNNSAFWQNAYTQTPLKPQPRKVDNSPNYFNSPWLYGWGSTGQGWDGSPYRMWPAAPTPAAPPPAAPPSGGGWGGYYGGGGGGGYSNTPYPPQWYLNTGLWRI